MLVHLSTAAKVARIVYTLFSALSALLAIFTRSPQRLRLV